MPAVADMVKHARHIPAIAAHEKLGMDLPSFTFGST